MGNSPGGTGFEAGPNCLRVGEFLTYGALPANGNRHQSAPGIARITGDDMGETGSTMPATTKASKERRVFVQEQRALQEPASRASSRTSRYWETGLKPLTLDKTGGLLMPSATFPSVL